MTPSPAGQADLRLAEHHVIQKVRDVRPVSPVDADLGTGIEHIVGPELRTSSTSPALHDLRAFAPPGKDAASPSCAARRRIFSLFTQRHLFIFGPIRSASTIFHRQRRLLIVLIMRRNAEQTQAVDAFSP